MELDSHWQWFKVDVTRSFTQPPFASEMEVGEVRTIKRDLKAQDTLRLGQYEVRLEKVKSMESHSWTHGHARDFAEEDVVVMQETTGDVRPWWIIVRVPKRSALARALVDHAGSWSTDAVVLFSGRSALFKQGAAIDNDDLPVKFTGGGGVQHDLLVYTTTYQQMGGGFSIIPESIFEVALSQVMPKLRKGGREDGELLQEFFFNSDGGVTEGTMKSIKDCYYARVVTKGWWYEEVSWCFIWALFTAIDWYNNVIFVCLTYRSTYLSLSFLAIILAFLFLECYFCYLLAGQNMRYQVHAEDMALKPSKCEFYPLQMLLYYLRVPIAVRDMTIWTCPRGVALGRAVVKAKKARIHILTWPTKYHYLCDFAQNRHKILPTLLVKSLVLLLIQVLIVFQMQNLVRFLQVLIPKLLLILSMAFSFADLRHNREALQAWLLGEWKSMGGNGCCFPEEEPMGRGLKTLYGVYKKHFADAPDGDLQHYYWLSPSVLLPFHFGKEGLPRKAFTVVVVTVGFATIAGWLADEWL